MQLLLIRHGESSANAEGRLQGRLDSPLSDRGRQQSALLAERLAPLAAVALYTSTLLRARQTAEILGEQLGLAVAGRPALMERDMGELAGLTADEARARFSGIARARAEGRPTGIPGFEEDEPFSQRVRDVMRAIVDAHDDGAIAVITHGGVIGSFLRQTLGMPLSRRGPFAIDNASVTILDVRHAQDSARQRIQLIGLNDTCHLDGLRP